MIGDILSEEWLLALYPHAEIVPVQFTCARVAGVKNKEWERLDSVLRGPTFFIGLVNPNDIDRVTFLFESHLVGANSSVNNDYVQLMKFDEVKTTSAVDDFFQLFGYLVTPK